MSRVRLLSKTALEGLSVLSGVAALGRQVMNRRVLILAYHNVVPVGEARSGDLSLHLPQSMFSHQLDLLVESHEIIPLERVFEAPGHSGRPRAVITFDDAYAGAVTAGIDEVRRRKLPATIFVAPAFLEGHAFWWDSLASMEGLDETVRQHALWKCRGQDAAVRRWAHDSGLPTQAIPPHATAATIGQLKGAVEGGAITLGSHTWSHPNLNALTAGEQRQELERSRAWLAEKFPGSLAWLSYPYGLADAGVQQVAASLPYTAGLRVNGGWLPREGIEPFALPRLNIPAGISLKGFELRAAGYLCG